MTRATGFTLLELLLVLAIITLLGSLVAPSIVGRTAAAHRAHALADMHRIGEALDLYRLDAGRYPTTHQGLAALTRRPDDPPIPAHWNSTGYTESIPVDPWGRPYRYAATSPHAFLLRSLGADDAVGGRGADGDIEVPHP